ncbi:hypothetical protein DL98DRAFT_594849 [Cadophora sp. DSE1049]|nr:hypothetical protein DL98DRAFT_594849 [Cadophora sp. DSE1049]
MESTKAPRKAWTRDEIVASLAWLDFCIQHRLDYRETVVEHLSELATGRSHPCSVQQILQKLVDLQRHDDNPCSRKDTVERGSRCWKGIPEDIREGVANALKRYTEGNFYTKYRGLGVHRNDDFPSSSKSLDKGEIGSGQERNANAGTGFSQTSTAQHTSQLLGGHKMTPAHDANTNTNANVSEAPSQASKPSHQPRETSKRRAQVSNDPSPTTEDTLRASLQQKNLELTTLRSTWHREVDALRTTISQHTQTELSLRAEIQHLVIARQARELAGKDPLEYELFQLNQTVWSLNRRVHEMQKLAGFAKMDGEGRDGVERRGVDEAMERIAEELQLLGCGRDVVVPRVEENGDLIALLRTVMEDTLEEKDKVEELRIVLAKLGAGVLVRTFVLAALRDWVFASAFPDFSPRNVKLLQAYRKIIIAHDGWNSLHNLELAVYDSLIDDNDFREVLVPRKARQLTDRLLKALVPLFSSNPKHPIAETWRDRPQVEEERRFRLSEIFEAALHLKASLVRVDQSFEFVIFPPGTSNSKERSHIDGQGDDRPDANQNGDHWLAASIHLYRTDASLPRDALKDALVQSRKFIKKSVEDRRETSLYTKTLLLPKSETTMENGCHDSSSEDEETQRSDDEYEGGKSSPVPQDRRRRRIMLPESEKQFECPICARRFAYARSLQQHSKKEECSRCNMCAMVFSSSRELQAHCKSVHQIAAPVPNRLVETRPNFVPGNIEATNAPVIQPGKSTAESTVQTIPAETQITDNMGKTMINSEMEGSTKRRRATSKPTNYRKDSDAEFSSPSSSEDGSAPKKHQRQRRNTCDRPTWIESPSSSSGKPRYKCRLCPKDFSAPGSCNRHFDFHPTCLKEGIGHVVSESDRALGKERVSCQECSKVLLLRRRPAVSSEPNSSSADQPHRAANGNEYNTHSQKTAVGTKRPVEDSVEHQDSEPRPTKNARTSST